MDREYGQVWKFLRDFELPYCRLYDEGYTSLGKTSDTLPNPYLRRKGLLLDDSHIQGNNSEVYWPAYMLADWTKERAGRYVRLISNILWSRPITDTMLYCLTIYVSFRVSATRESLPSTPAVSSKAPAYNPSMSLSLPDDMFQNVSEGLFIDDGISTRDHQSV